MTKEIHVERQYRKVADVGLQAEESRVSGAKAPVCESAMTSLYRKIRADAYYKLSSVHKRLKGSRRIASG